MVAEEMRDAGVGPISLPKQKRITRKCLPIMYTQNERMNHIRYQDTCPQNFEQIENNRERNNTMSKPKR